MNQIVSWKKVCLATRHSLNHIKIQGFAIIDQVYYLSILKIIIGINVLLKENWGWAYHIYHIYLHNIL